ncbi:P-loop NTPase fold protein [Flavobacterium sp. DG2-3]|uniref:KAP family P-loop NTPase fold protein n=1 Tax=Flavobacterium sp. DG2-3 TaxID=3068317 RepID=UPI00273F2F15|nr:P-loop NTPase fold protein [Flavobacterium sp. DG2-3]MDP5199908.1 P-loop NTPase fold protein [Flavobacterium sp. DG2-3]
MGIKHKEFEISQDNPFENCKLNRKKYADILTNIIESYTEGFVLAINNKWGSGKTTFVRMWEQELKNKSFQTLYFNAWENDFENNPLTALVGELKKLTKKDEEPKFQDVLKNAAILSKHIGPILVQAIAEKYFDTSNLKDSIGKITEGIADIFEKDVDNYIEKKNGIADFRKSLSEFIANSCNDRPLVFIIDELDRCRPNYAVLILEQIKHFFSVPNIVFILAIDKVQLGNAVCGVYGSEKIDSDEYLRRFIDIEYNIPEPSGADFSLYLYEYFEFSEFFTNANRVQYLELKNDETIFISIAKVLFANSSITLRKQEKIFAHSRLVLRTFPENFQVVPFVFLFLIYAKILNEEFYMEIKSKKLNLSQLQIKFFEIVRTRKNEENEEQLMWLEAYLIIYYNNYTKEDSNIFYRDQSGKRILNIKSMIDKNDTSYFLDVFRRIYETRNLSSFSIDYFLNRIDLTVDLIRA